MDYYIQVNAQWVLLAQKAIDKYLKDWPGGDPEEQEAAIQIKGDLDRLALEYMYSRQTHKP